MKRQAGEKRIPVRFSDEEWHRLDDERHKRGVQWQALGEILWRRWLDEAAHLVTEPHLVPAPPPRPHADMHDTLDRILDSGHDVAISAVTENLIASDRLVSIDKRAGKKYRGAQSRPEERKLG